MLLWLQILWARLVGVNPYGLKPHIHNDKLITFEGKLKDGKSYYFASAKHLVKFDVYEAGHRNWKSKTAFDRRLEYKPNRMTKRQAIRLCTFWIKEYYETI